MNDIHGIDATTYELRYNGHTDGPYFDRSYDVKVKRYAEFVKLCKAGQEPLSWYSCEDCGMVNDKGIVCQCRITYQDSYPSLQQAQYWANDLGYEYVIVLGGKWSNLMYPWVVWERNKKCIS